MDEDSYISIYNEYYNFRRQIFKNIKSNKITMDPKDCYLLEETWINDLIEYFNKYDELKEQNKINHKLDYLNYLPEDDPEFINDIPSILDCIKNNKKFMLVSKKLIESIYDKEELVDKNI